MINLKNNKATKTNFDELNKQIIKEETEINEELFKKHFHFQTTTAMLKYSYNLNDRNKNNKLLDIIKSGLSDLKNKIKKMSKDEIKNEKPRKIVDIVEKILEFNKQNQEREGLKILTPN